MVFAVEQLLYLCTDLLIAGSDTTSGTLSFALMYMVLYPEVQVNVQKELDDVVGRERLPSLNDKAKQVFFVLITYCLFNDAHSSDYAASDDRIISPLKLSGNYM
jgi:cytochrome P450